MQLSPVANFEEVDWCRRAWKAGWKVAFCPAAQVIHYGGQSLWPAGRSGIDWTRVELMRSLLAYLAKHDGRWVASAAACAYALTLPWNALVVFQSWLRGAHCELGRGTIWRPGQLPPGPGQVSFGPLSSGRSAYDHHHRPSPIISVVIPTCRRPDFLARCLDRLAPGSQTLPADQYEVIVTDDGDPTVERLLAEKYPWVSWGQGPRRGPAANRNAGPGGPARSGLRSPTMIACRTQTGCRVYGSGTLGLPGVRREDYLCSWDSLSLRPRASEYYRRVPLVVQHLHPAGTFEEIGGFDEKFPFPYMEDADLRERLVHAGHPFEFIPDAVVDHPPRRPASGRQLARYHESWVYYLV